MLGLATNGESTLWGTSVFKIASTWNMKILKYADLMCCVKEHQYAPAIRLLIQVTKYKKGYVCRLRGSPFVKVEDHSRKFRPEFVEMKSFPYLDFDTEGTTSPFDTWFRENYTPTKKWYNLTNFVLYDNSWKFVNFIQLFSHISLVCGHFVVSSLTFYNRSN